MFKRFKVFVKKHQRFLAILAIIVTVVIAYGQTLRMYFWQDDSALIFKLQNPEGPAGSFGKGIVGDGAYKYLVVPFVPFFKIFGLEPTGYFAVGLLTYFLATGAFYVFSRELFGTLRLASLAQGKRAIFFSTLIFASGYIGSETMFRIINSWQTNIGIVLTLLTFWMFVKCLRGGGLLKYLFSLFLFFITIKFVFIRSHSLILPLFAIDLLFLLQNLKIRKNVGRSRNLFFLALRQIPFWFLWVKYYLSDSSFGGPGLLKLAEEVVVNGRFAKLTPLFANIGNGLIVDTISAKVVSQSFLLGLGIAIVAIFTWILLLRKKNPLSIPLAFGFIFVASQIFGYFTQYPDAIFSSTHRYFSYSAIGFAIFWGTVCYLTWTSRKKLQNFAIVPLILIVGVNLVLGFRYQKRIVEERSIPTREFYKSLKSYLPAIEKGSAFYFGVARDPFSQRQFANFFSVGSMPESTALAIYYGVDRYDVYMITDFNELAYKLDIGEIKKDKLYAFFYKDGMLSQITDKVRENLWQRSDVEKVADFERDVSYVTNPGTPVLVSFEVALKPSDPPKTFPYYKGKGDKLTFSAKEGILSYISEKESYYQRVMVESDSEWKFRELRNVVDNDQETVWQGHRIYWYENHKENLTIDLGAIFRVGRVIWRNWTPSLSPTSYVIETSFDKKNWRVVRAQVKAKERSAGEIVTEDFEPALARFVRMKITETASDDSPAITEFLVLSGDLREIDALLVERFEEDPFAYVSDEEEWMRLFQNPSLPSKMTVVMETDAGETKIAQPIKIDKKRHSYEFVFPASGTKITKLYYSVNVPVSPSIDQILLRNLSLSELGKRGLIKAVKEN